MLDWRLRKRGQKKGQEGIKTGVDYQDDVVVILQVMG